MAKRQTYNTSAELSKRVCFLTEVTDKLVGKTTPAYQSELANERIRNLEVWLYFLRESVGEASFMIGAMESNDDSVYRAGKLARDMLRDIWAHLGDYFDDTCEEDDDE